MDAAIDMQDEINRYLRQPVEQPSTLADARDGLLRLASTVQANGWNDDDVPNLIFDWRRCCGSANRCATSAAQRLAEAQRADERARRPIDAARRMEQQRVQGECRKAAGPGEVDVDRLVEAHRYAVVACRLARAELHEQRQALAAEIDRRRQSLFKADQDVQVLEKLRDRRLRRYRLEEERQQAKQTR